MLISIFFISCFLQNIVYYYMFSIKPYLFIFPFVLLLNGRKVFLIIMQHSRIAQWLFLILLVYGFLTSLWAIMPSVHLRLNLALFISIMSYFVLSANQEIIHRNLKVLTLTINIIFVIAIVAYFYNIIFVGTSALREYWVNCIVKNRTSLANSVQTFTYVGYDFYPRFNGFSLDPNFSSLYCFLALYVTLIYIKISEKGQHLIVIPIISLFLTFSRGAFISILAALSVVACLYFISHKKNRITNKSLFPWIALISGIFMAGIIFRVNMGGGIDLAVFLERLKVGFHGNDHRMTYLWPQYVKLLKEPFGYGWNYGVAIIGGQTHNTYLQVYEGVGVVGGLCLFGALGMYFVKAWSQKHFLAVFGIVFLMLQMASLDMIFEIGVWILLFMIEFSIKQCSTIHRSAFSRGAI